MPGSATAIRQERLKTTHSRTIPLVLFTINEEDELQKNGNSRRPKGMLMPYSFTGARYANALLLRWSPAQRCAPLLIAQVLNCARNACFSEYS